MRNRCLILLSTLGMLACTGKRLLVGEDGAGGVQAGQSGAFGGLAGASGQAGGGLGGGATGSGGATGIVGAAGQPGGAGLSLLAGEIGGPGTADGNGTTARFYFPVAVVTDGAGNLYVADSVNGTIRKIAIATGAVTTLAGNARQTGTVDGLGAAARFSDLKSIASDGAGNLYVADGTAIRQVVMASGAVTTLADDTGAPVEIVGPSGIASDGAGYLYVASTTTPNGTTDSTIRKISIATGTVTTLADRTSASIHFDALYDMVSDRAGNLYVADGAVIEKVVIATGVVSTFAGTPGLSGSDDGIGAAARLGGYSGMASDGAGNLYFTEGGAHTVRRVVIATGAVTTLAGTPGQYGSQDGVGAAASFGNPQGIASDGAGNLYVADVYNNTIRKVVVTTGAVTTFAGAPGHESNVDGTGAAARFGLPAGAAGDGAGNLYVADRDAATIRKVVIATGAVTTLAGTGQPGAADGTGTAAGFSQPNGIATDGAGNLYVADSATIRKIVIATGAVTTLAGSADQPSGSADGTGTNARFNSAYGIASDGAGNLYLADSGNNTIRKVVIATRAVTTLAGTAGQTGSMDGTGAAASFNFPCDITADGAGNLYVADSSNNTIRKVVIATGAVTTLAGAAGAAGSADGTGAAARFNGPSGITADGAGNLYVADGNTIRKIAISSAAVSTVIGIPGRWGVLLGALPASLNLPRSIAVLPAGQLAIVDTLENSVLIGHL